MKQKTLRFGQYSGLLQEKQKSLKMIQCDVARMRRLNNYVMSTDRNNFHELKCVWAVFGSQRKSLTLDIIIPTTRSMLWCNFLWGLRNWLHKTRPPYFGSIRNIDVETHVTTHGGLSQWLALYNLCRTQPCNE